MGCKFHQPLQSCSGSFAGGGVPRPGALSLCGGTSTRILVLLTDLMDKDGYERALRVLLAQQLDVYLVQILSPEELEPGLKGDLRLLDSEDSDVAEITVSRPVLDRYKRTLERFVRDVREYCTRRGITYMLADTRVSVETVVTQYLRQRGLVR